MLSKLLLLRAQTQRFGVVPKAFTYLVKAVIYPSPRLKPANRFPSQGAGESLRLQTG